MLELKAKNQEVASRTGQSAALARGSKRKEAWPSAGTLVLQSRLPNQAVQVHLLDLLLLLLAPQERC